MQMKLFAIAAVSAVASFGAVAGTTQNLGTLSINSQADIGPTYVDMATAVDGTINFTLATDSLVSGYVATDVEHYVADGAYVAFDIANFNVKIDGKSFGTLSSTVVQHNTGPDTYDNYDNITRQYTLYPTKFLAGAHTIKVTGTADTYNDVAYYGQLTIHEVSVVPEPETYALLLAGLGALGFLARRRQA